MENQNTFIFEDNVGVTSTQLDVLFAGFFDAVVFVIFIGGHCGRRSIAAQLQARY